MGRRFSWQAGLRGRPRRGPVTALAGACCVAVTMAACTGGSASKAATSPAGVLPSVPSAMVSTSSPGAPADRSVGASAGSSATEPTGQATLAFAGDVHFAERTATRLAADPATAFGESAAVLSAADLTMVNLETAIAVGGTAQNKSFTFEAPPSAFTALKDAGVDIATMANNHGADYGSGGLAQTLAAISASHFPVVGIGADANAAYAAYYKTVNGVRVAILAASQVTDETLANFTATASSPGIASAFSAQFLAGVRAAKARADVVVVYVHWGTEYSSCPNALQQSLATSLSEAGATAVIGTHAHVLQGAGWRTDGTYVAYGLGNYFWWRSFGNDQDDNGVLTLTVRPGKVVAASFSPSELDSRGIGVPAVGANKTRILAEWDKVRQCADLSVTPPS